VKTWKMDRIFDKGQEKTIGQEERQQLDNNEQRIFSNEERWPKSSDAEGRERRSSKVQGKS
jgi:hypothetical protein